MSGATRMADLVGQPMSGVSFVHDYVEFLFDGMILRSLTDPVVTSGKASFAMPREGARDAFCALIGERVSNVVVREGDRIDLRFEGGSLITVPLGDSDRRGPEAAHFVPGENQPIEVW